jgi:hypothetical protein
MDSLTPAFDWRSSDDRHPGQREMPSAIPDRFHLEIRLGRDDDIEEWLATDRSLDRPVLIRSLGPDSTAERRDQFVMSVGRVASVAHPHLTRVYMVERVPGGAYAVLEWTGASSLADHITAGRPIDLAEFLPNASGLAGAVATLHEHGVTHGGIDPTAISYSAAHPAKLGAFGRRPMTDRAGDVRSLGAALETALTGREAGGPAPSESIDGVTPAIDRILRGAQNGTIDARALEEAFLAAPTPRLPSPGTGTGSRRLVYSALGLLAFAVGLIILGLLFSGGSTEPVLPTRPEPATTTTVPPTTTAPSGQVRPLSAIAFDPYGLDPSADRNAQLLIDGDPATVWFSPTLPTQLEPGNGFGVMISVDGRPSRVDLVGLGPGTVFELRWASTPHPDPGAWQTLATARSVPGLTSVQAASRDDGHWLIWFLALPVDGAGQFRTSLAEVTFHP